MKKLLAFSLTVVMALSLCACKKIPDSGAWKEAESSDNAGETSTARTVEALTLKKIDPSKIVVAYFDLRGGVKETADAFVSELGCASFEIVPVLAYPEDEAAMLERADREFEKNEYPALSGYLENASDNLAVIAVYPELNGNMPMALKTFLDDYDLRRTAVLPVCVCSGENAGKSFEQIRETIVSAPVYSGLEIHSGDDISALCAEWVNAALK